MSQTPLLEVKDLKVAFRGADGRMMQAVDGVSFEVRRGRTLGIVGESGCGKSVTSLATTGLLPIKGLDEVGRDLFARIIYGTRASLLADVISVSVAIACGVPLGLLQAIVVAGPTHCSAGLPMRCWLARFSFSPSPWQRFWGHPYKMR